MLRKIARLFEPTLNTKKASSKEMIEAAVGYINFDILPLFTIPYIITLLQDELYHYAFVICLWAFGTHLFLWFINYFMRPWDLDAKYAMNAFLEKRYRKEIFLKDHKAFDLVGTGKAQSIIQKGMDEWSELNWGVLYQVPKLIVGLISGLYIMFRFDIAYLTAFIVLTIVGVCVVCVLSGFEKKLQGKKQ